MAENQNGPLSKFFAYLRVVISVALGVAIGTCAFLVLAAFVLGHPIRDALASAYGVLFSPPPNGLTALDKNEIEHLIKIGAILPAQDILEAVSRYYEGESSRVFGRI